MALLQYNLAYSGSSGYANRDQTNRLNSGPGSYRGTSNRYNDTHRFNTNSLTVTNPLHAETQRNLTNSPHTTASTALNNSPATAHSENRNTFYENSADDEHTNDDNDGVASVNQSLYNRVPTHSPRSPDVRPRTNSLFDRHS